MWSYIVNWDVHIIYFYLAFLAWVLGPNMFPLPEFLPEDCANAIDDDGDGLVDLNDPDCTCILDEIPSLIPNPSFEEMTCCPTLDSKLECATDWQQASAATTDYLHTCSWMGFEFAPPPIPFPDGDACIGFLDVNNNWKEYTGACLLAPLSAGIKYKFQFSIGFSEIGASEPIELSFFGTEDCSNLPFGGGDPLFGCPLNGPNWIELGSIELEGVREWITTEIEISPDVDIYAIAIGPPCKVPPGANSRYYYFFDNLLLNEVNTADFSLIPINHTCSNEFGLEFPWQDLTNYQWYKDGVALIGETGNVLQSVVDEGSYQIMALNELGCSLSDPFIFEVPVLIENISEKICAGETYFFDGMQLNMAGQYIDTTVDANGCDSITILDLSIDMDFVDTSRVKIFKGESILIDGVAYSDQGIYEILYQSEIGCDSLILIEVSFFNVFAPNVFSPNGDGQNDRFILFGGDGVESITEFEIYGRWGQLIFQEDNITLSESNGWDGTANGNKMGEGIYIYKALVKFNDGVERLFKGDLLLLR